MARHFTSTDRITCAVGSCGAVGSGAYTMVWLYRIDLFAGVGGLGALRRSGGYAREALVTGNRLFGLNEFTGNGFPSSPASALPEEQWIWVAQRKAAGSAHYEWAYGLYPIADPDTDIVFGEDSGAANHTDPGAGDEVWIGSVEVNGGRDIALQAFFTSRLSDATIKGIFTDALSDLVAAGPAGCWPLNQADAEDDVPDVTENGADSTSITGTTIVDDPDGYDFSLTPPSNDAELAGTFPLPTAALTSDVQNDAVLAGVLPMPTAALTADIQNDAAASGTFPLATAALTADSLNDAALAGVLPLPTAALTAEIPLDAVLAGTFPLPVLQLFDEQALGAGPRDIARTPIGRHTQTTPAGRSVR